MNANRAVCEGVASHLYLEMTINQGLVKNGIKYSFKNTGLKCVQYNVWVYHQNYLHTLRRDALSDRSILLWSYLTALISYSWLKGIMGTKFQTPSPVELDV